MNGLLWKALRREWWVVRWPAFAWLCVLRFLLRVRWFVLGSLRGIGTGCVVLYDGFGDGCRAVGRGLVDGGAAVGRWFAEGWGANWIKWRWAGIAPVVAAVAIVLRELVRPFVAFARGLFVEFEERDRKWILPSVAGTIGLLLMVLLFLSQSGGKLRSDTDDALAAFRTADAPPPQPAPRLVDLEPRIEPAPWIDPEPIPNLEPEPEPVRELRDPFAAMEPKPAPPREPVLEPEPEPEFDLLPQFDPLPLVAVDPPPKVEPPPLVDDPLPPLEPLLAREPPTAPTPPRDLDIPDWPTEPQADPRPLPTDLAMTLAHDPPLPAWQPRLEDGTDFFVASNPRTLDFEGIGPLDPAAEPDGWGGRRPRGEFAAIVPVVHSVREFAAATASSTLVRDRRPVVEFAAFMKERSRVGETCAVEFRAVNVGEVPIEGLVVRIDLPEQFDHRFGRKIDYEVGTLSPGEHRSARLVIACTRPGAGTVQVRLEGDEIAEIRNRVFEVARTDVTPIPVRSEQSAPVPVEPKPAEIAPPEPEPAATESAITIQQRPRSPAPPKTSRPTVRRAPDPRLGSDPACCCPPRY